MSRIEISAADIADLSRLAELCQPAGGLQPALDRIVPPVELDEIEPFRLQALQRDVDGRLDGLAGHVAELFEIGHELGMDRDPVERLLAALARP